MIKAKLKREWHEDYGNVVWWKFPVTEPAWIGKPLDSDWPGYHTHWTPHPEIPQQHYDKLKRDFKLLAKKNPLVRRVFCYLKDDLFQKA